MPSLRHETARCRRDLGSFASEGECWSHCPTSLDEFVIYNLPVAFKSGNTTVLFPSAISGLYAKSVAVQEQANADFLISFTLGNFYFTVRALEPNAEDHLTVIHNRKAYVLHLIASEQPHFHVMIRDVWRFEQEDTLIFRVELVNDSDSTIFLAALCRAKTVAKVGNRERPRYYRIY